MAGALGRLASAARVFPHLNLHPVKVADDFSRQETGLPGFGVSIRPVLLADFLQFTSIEPITSAIRAMIYLNSDSWAEQMAFQFDPGTTRTLTFAVVVNP